MSIRPVDFNGMIQNTNEVSSVKAQEDSKSVLQQSNVSVEMTKQQEKLSKQVNQSQDKDQEYRYDREGNGRGYQRNQNGKRQNSQDEKGGKEGFVRTKMPKSSFDIKI